MTGLFGAVGINPNGLGGEPRQWSRRDPPPAKPVHAHSCGSMRFWTERARPGPWRCMGCVPPPGGLRFGEVNAALVQTCLL